VVVTQSWGAGKSGGSAGGSQKHYAVWGLVTSIFATVSNKHALVWQTIRIRVWLHRALSAHTLLQLSHQKQTEPWCWLERSDQWSQRLARLHPTWAHTWHPSDGFPVTALTLCRTQRRSGTCPIGHLRLTIHAAKIDYLNPVCPRLNH
jgi:hypothetical protein